MYSRPEFVDITQQPSSPTQHCVAGNARIGIESSGLPRDVLKARRDSKFKEK